MAAEAKAITWQSIVIIVSIIGGAATLITWMGFSPGKMLDIQAAEAAYERKAEAKIIHDTLGHALEKMDTKLDALIQSNVRAQTKLEELQRGGR